MIVFNEKKILHKCPLNSLHVFLPQKNPTQLAHLKQTRRMSFYLKFLLQLLFLGSSAGAGAQHLSVQVLSQKNIPLPKAILELKCGNQTQLFETDSLGKVLIPENQEIGGCKLRAVCTGFQEDSIYLSGRNNLRILLQEIQQLDEIEIKARAQAAFLEKTAVIKTEVINRQELKKAACCDLAGCFETQGTVQPQVSNVLSNAKELRILGLAGVYNQLLVDGMPTLVGLSYPFGISGIPGPMVENIYVSKGTNSVLQGFESISGQINVITTEAEKIKSSFYINQFQEAHLNAAISQHFENGSFVAGIHSVQPAGRRDRDGDGFLDVTRLRRRMIFLNGKWQSDRIFGEYGLRYSVESRSSGQYEFNPEKDEGSNQKYGHSIGFSQLDGRKKLEYRIREDQRIILQVAGQLHRQESWYGTLNYRGHQVLAYGNFQYEKIWNGHLLKTGLSQRFLDASEQIRLGSDPAARTFDGTYRKLEIIPGIFAENSFSFRDEHIKLITGIRADHHNKFGWKVVPRIMLRADFSSNSILRINAGRGWRTLNLFTDHAQILAGNRNLQIDDNLIPESAWNSGMSFTQNFEGESFNAYLSGDVYYTFFENQLFPDYRKSGSSIQFRNFGQSAGNEPSESSQSWYAQLEGKLSLRQGPSLRFSYSYTENFRRTPDGKTVLPFTPLHRGLLAISWRKAAWQLDMNQHLYGSQYLPDTRQNPEAYRTPQKSPAFQITNLQIIRFQKSIEIYAGCENIINFRQLRPMTAWQEPFSPWFDTAGVWGPTRGREFYAGIRFRISNP